MENANARHIGIDLHRNQFTCCMRLENGRNYLSDWKLEELPKFLKKLRPSDEIAVEVTGNTRFFHDAVAPQVARVVAVDPNQFKVISHSVKKTDPNDARNLALYLEKDLLPEVRMKEKTQARSGHRSDQSPLRGQTPQSNMQPVTCLLRSRLPSFDAYPAGA
jgi:transposase